MSAKRLETVVVKQAMTRVKEEKMPFGWSINPYRGCAHGCSFCYARAFQSFIGLGSDEFQDHILVKDNAAEALRKQLHNMAASRRFDLQELARDIGHIAIGTATDPYQPAESSRQVTRECLKVLARYRVPVSITTRSPLVLRDMDILADLNLLSVNISLNTLDDELIRFLEPGAPLPRQRLQALAELRNAGFPAGVFAAPILPLLTDSRPRLDELTGAVKEAGAGYMMTSLLRLTPDVKSWYYGMLQRYDASLLPAYDRIFAGAYASRDYAERIQRIVSELRVVHGIPEDRFYRESAGSVRESGRGKADAMLAAPKREGRAVPVGSEWAESVNEGISKLNVRADLSPAAANEHAGQRPLSEEPGLAGKLARLREIPGAGCTPGTEIEVLEQMSLPF